eukprot:5103802-Prymnesium_polylepis.2
MAAVLYDRQTLSQRVGMLMEGPPNDEMPYDYAEGQYAVRVGLAGLCTARPYFEDLHDARGACVAVDADGGALPEEEALALELAFRQQTAEQTRQRAAAGSASPQAADAESSGGHTGGPLLPVGHGRPCHQLFIETRPPRPRELSDFR